jgi:hypothetical protein
MAIGLAGPGTVVPNAPPYSGTVGTTTPVLYPAGSTQADYVASGFVPEIWSGKLIEKFYAATVLAAISNTDYEGEIRSYGDRVKIRQKATLAINNYLVGGDLSLQRPVGSALELYIDQGIYFAAILDDIIEKQSDINNLSIWADDASEQMKINVDTNVLRFILNTAYAGPAGTPSAPTAGANMGANAGWVSGNINLGTTAAPVATVGRNPTTGQVEIIDVILRLGQCLDEQNIPETGRWVIMPTWATFQLKRSELREVFVSGDQTSILRNGRYGQVDRFVIYASNLLPNGTAGGLAAGVFPIFAGHAHGLTFASQLTNVETIRSERTFGQILRGLQVYGRAALTSGWTPPNASGVPQAIPAGQTEAIAQALIIQGGP